MIAGLGGLDMIRHTATAMAVVARALKSRSESVVKRPEKINSEMLAIR